MNTTTLKTASTTAILAIDLGKYKSVACMHDEASGEFRFTTFETTRAELSRLLAREQPAVLIIETCLLAGWVHDLCGELGVRCLVANTASEAWKFKHLKRKTDKDNALRLALARPDGGYCAYFAKIDSRFQSNANTKSEIRWAESMVGGGETGGVSLECRGSR